jgi:hypothetical protein
LAAAAAAVKKREKSLDKKVQDSESFAFNIFRGKIALNQVIPYPPKLEGEELEHVQMLVPPAERYFTVSLKSG